MYKRQVKINGTQTQIVALIVPKHVHECIIGVDTLLEWKEKINFKRNTITMEIDTKKISVHIKEFKHWKSVSVIKGYREKPLVDVRSDQHCIEDTPEINIGTGLNSEQQNQIQLI